MQTPTLVPDSVPKPSLSLSRDPAPFSPPLPWISDAEFLHQGCTEGEGGVAKTKRKEGAFLECSGILPKPSITSCLKMTLTSTGGSLGMRDGGGRSKQDVNLRPNSNEPYSLPFRDS